jgi:predicted dehydrogenase
MPLRVGVIGLGHRWRRYRPLLARLREHIEVRAVCDQIGQRTENQARRFACAAASGPVELLERADVQAVLLLEAQWYGLWPLEYACRINKPVLCALSPACDGAHVDALAEQIQRSALPTFMALPPLLVPVTQHLRELLTQRLGQARFLRADCCMALRDGVDLLQNPSLSAILSACAWLLDDAPRNIQMLEGEAAGFKTLLLRFGGERLAQVNLWTATAGRTPLRFEVVAETGTATAELPRQLRWRDADGQHAQRLPPRSIEQNALERFILGLRSGQPLRPSFEEVYQALTWLRAAERGRNEGQSIPLRKTVP